MPHEVLSKAICPVCRRFFGLITSDGRGPVFHDCPALEAEVRYKECPMYKKLAPFQSPCRPTGLGSGTKGWLNDTDAFRKANDQ